MAHRIHQVAQHRVNISGIEAMTLISNHHFPRHSHDQFGIGVIASGAHRSWSGIGQVEALAGDTIMVNPGEMHDGAPLDSNARTWQMLYFSPELVIDQVKEDLAGQIEIVRPVVHDPLLSRHFSRLFTSLTDSQADHLAIEENLIRSLIYMMRRHGMSRL